MEDLLDKVVRLLAYVSDKDLFSEFYRKKLARRLLSERSASDDHERSILTRLKQQCGAAFTSKVLLYCVCVCIVFGGGILPCVCVCVRAAVYIPPNVCVCVWCW